MENIFVTGGAGFIGSHIIEHHLHQGDKVWAIDNFSTGCKENIACFLQKKSFRFDEAEVTTFGELQRAVEWSDKIYHGAATVGMLNVLAHPTETLSNNIHTTERILQSMARTSKPIRCLIMSSSGVYSSSALRADGRFYEDATLHIPSGASIQECYALSKIVGETMALSYAAEKGLDCVVARIFNTIGPRQKGCYGMVVPKLVHQAFQGESITVYGDGSQTRSFCNVHDTVHALDLLLQSVKTRGEIFNVGRDEEITILKLAHLIQEKTQSVSKISFLPYRQAYGMEFSDEMKRRPSIAKLEQWTSFKPQWSLDQTLDEIIEDIRRKEAHLRKKVG